MRRSRWLAVVLVAATLLVTACSKTSAPVVLEHPPDLAVSIGTTSIATTTEEYTWNNRNGEERQRAPGPGMLLDRLGEPAAVPPGSVAKLSLVLPPDEGTLVWQQWRPDFSRTPAEPVKDGGFLLPEKPGVYIYTVSARWLQGEVRYAFRVEVR